MSGWSRKIGSSSPTSDTIRNHKDIIMQVMQLIYKEQAAMGKIFLKCPLCKQLLEKEKHMKQHYQYWCAGYANTIPQSTT